MIVYHVDAINFILSHYKIICTHIFHLQSTAKKEKLAKLREYLASNHFQSHKHEENIR